MANTTKRIKSLMRVYLPFHINFYFYGILTTNMFASPQTLASNHYFSQLPAEVTLMSNLSVDERLEKIENKIDTLEKRPKDFWDKINAVSGLISGGLVAIIGIAATYAYNERQRRNSEEQKQREILVLQVQAALGFMPQLQSNDEKSQEAAILCIYALGNRELAKNIGEVFKTQGTINALRRIEGKETQDDYLEYLKSDKYLEYLKNLGVDAFLGDPLKRISENRAISNLLEKNSDQVKALAKESCDMVLNTLSKSRLDDLGFSNQDTRYAFYSDIYLYLMVWLKNSLEYFMLMPDIKRSIPDKTIYVEAIKFLRDNRLEYFLLSDKELEEVLRGYLDSLINMLEVIDD